MTRIVASALALVVSLLIALLLTGIRQSNWVYVGIAALSLATLLAAAWYFDK